MIEVFGQRIREGVDAVAARFFNVLSLDLAAGLYLIAALIGLMLIANFVLQIQQLTFSAFFGWILRMTIIISAATSAVFFINIYAAAMSFPDQVAAALSGGNSVFGALDVAVTNAMNRGAEAMGEGAITSPETWVIALAGLVLWVIGAMLGAMGLVVAAIAFAGLGITLGLAPIFISALITPATSDFFGSWVKFLTGFAMVLIMLAGVMGIVTEVFSSVLASADTNADLQTLGGFVIAILVSIVLTSQIPQFASGLAGTVVVSGTGFARAIGMTQGFGNFMRSAGSSFGDTADGARGKFAMGRQMAREAAEGKGLRAKGALALKARREIMNAARTRSKGGRVRDAARARRDNRPSNKT